MASRGRDLEFRVLSNAERFDLEPAARDLETVGRAAQDAGRDLQRFDGDVARVDLDRIGTEARDTAKRVDDAFDSIARSSRSAARKLDDDADRIDSSFTDVRDEAGDTAREMAASFDGSADSVMDAFQELGANAGQAFGPVGIAAGAAAAVGVGLIRAETERIKELAGELVEEFVEAGGRLTEEVIDAKVLQFATEDAAGFAREKDLIDSLGLSWKDYARAKAGDAEAAERITQAMADLNAKMTEQAAAAGSASGEMYGQKVALDELAGNVGVATSAYELARQATADYSAAMSGSAAAAKKYTDKSAEAWDKLRSTYGEDIIGNLRVDSSGVLREAQLAWLEADAYFRRNPITLRTRQGTRPVRDVP